MQQVKELKTLDLVDKPAVPMIELKNRLIINVQKAPEQRAEIISEDVKPEDISVDLESFG